MDQQEDIIRLKADKYAHLAYELSRKFPKDEVYGLTSQFRRAALSTPLNIIEGHARQSTRSNTQFISIAYASLKESQYITEFVRQEGYITDHDAVEILDLGQEVAKMLWSKIKTLKAKSYNS